MVKPVLLLSELHRKLAGTAGLRGQVRGVEHPAQQVALQGSSCLPAPWELQGKDRTGVNGSAAGTGRAILFLFFK